MGNSRALSRGEELANSLTHGLGLLLSIVAFPVLVFAMAGKRDPLMVVAVSVFAASLIALYGASTIYHALPQSETKLFFRKVDHVAIYLLIAGTYTPFALGVLRGPLGWTLFGVIWALAAVGTVFKTSKLGFRYPRASTIIYVGMGWLAILAVKPFIAAMPINGIVWLFAGGLCYTGGVAFYVWEKLKYGHAVWHLFVLAGSTCHFIAVLLYSAV
jgi:hemolysin III